MDESTVMQVARELGNMDARIGNVEKDVTEMKGDLKTVNTSLNALHADVKTLLARPAVTESNAGRPLLTIGTTAAGGLGVGGLLVAAAQYVLGGGAQQPPAPPPYTPPAVVQPQPVPAEPIKPTQP